MLQDAKQVHNRYRWFVDDLINDCVVQVMDKHGEAHASIFSRGETGRLNSLSVVLSQEIDRFNRLTKQMQSSLRELQKAIKGLVVMSDELEQMLHSMLDSKVCRHNWDFIENQHIFKLQEEHFDRNRHVVGEDSCAQPYIPRKNRLTGAIHDTE